MNEREARESGLRLKAWVSRSGRLSGAELRPDTPQIPNSFPTSFRKEKYVPVAIILSGDDLITPISPDAAPKNELRPRCRIRARRDRRRRPAPPTRSRSAA
jgi:hypothetical protein